MKNEDKDASHRKVVENAHEEGVLVIEKQGRYQKKVPKSMCNEALLFSEMFDLNELSSLEFLMIGEFNLSRYPDMSQGTVAVLFYYQMRQNVVSNLNFLMQIVNGYTWAPKVPKEYSDLVTKYANDLRSERIVFKCLENLKSFNIDKEFEMLENFKALGPRQYRFQLRKTMENTKQMMASIIFSYSAQTNLTTEEMIEILKFLAKNAALHRDSLDKVTTILLLSLLYSIDKISLQNFDKLDLGLDSLESYVQKLSAVENHLQSESYSIEQIHFIIQLWLGISWRIVATSSLPHYVEDLMDKGNKFIRAAIVGNVFVALNNLIGRNRFVFEDRFFVHKLHAFHCNIFLNMDRELGEFRLKAIGYERMDLPDARPSSSLDFQRFLAYLTSFYGSDTYAFSKDFFYILTPNRRFFSHHKALHNFVCFLHESYCPQAVVSYVIDFFGSLARASPVDVFHLIKNVNIPQTCQFTMRAFMEVLEEYLRSVRGLNTSTASSIASQCKTDELLIRYNVINSIINLVQVLVESDTNLCRGFADPLKTPFLNCMVALLKCAIFREIKAKIFKCFAAFALSPPMAVSFLSDYEVCPRLIIVPNALRPMRNGVAIEMEDLEATHNEYPITLSFLEFFNVLFSHKKAFYLRSVHHLAVDSLRFIIEAHLLKSFSHVFKKEIEKWKMIELIYSVLCKIASTDLVDFSDLNSCKALVFSQTLQDGILFHHMIATLEEVVAYHQEHYVGLTVSADEERDAAVMKCGLTILSFLTSVCGEQDAFFKSFRQLPGCPKFIPCKLNELFDCVNWQTNKQDLLALLFRIMFLSKQLTRQTLQFLVALSENDIQLTHKCLVQISDSPSPSLKFEVLLQHFLGSIDDNELSKDVLTFLLAFLGNNSASFEPNIAYKLLGLENTSNNLKLFGRSYSCFHAVLSFVADINDRLFVTKLEERRLAMKIICKLCSCQPIHQVVLRFTRSTYSFVHQYLKFWSSVDEKPQDFSLQLHKDIVPSLLCELTYFMKICAIDYKMSSNQGLLSYCSSIVKHFYGESSRSKMMDLLYSSVLNHSLPEIENLQYLNVVELKRLILSCMYSEFWINIPYFHRKLLEEVKFSSKPVQDEVDHVIRYLFRVNASFKILSANVDYVKSWSELVRVIHLCQGVKLLHKEMHSKYSIELIIETVRKILDPSTNEHMIVYLSSTVLTISQSLTKEGMRHTSSLLSCYKDVLLTFTKVSFHCAHYEKIKINLLGAILYLIPLVPEYQLDEVKFSDVLLKKLGDGLFYGSVLSKVLILSFLTRIDHKLWLKHLIEDGTVAMLFNSILEDNRHIQDKFYVMSKENNLFKAKMVTTFFNIHFLLILLCS